MGGFETLPSCWHVTRAYSTALVSHTYQIHPLSPTTPLSHCPSLRHCPVLMQADRHPGAGQPVAAATSRCAFGLRFGVLIRAITVLSNCLRHMNPTHVCHCDSCHMLPPLLLPSHTTPAANRTRHISHHSDQRARQAAAAPAGDAAAASGAAAGQVAAWGGTEWGCAEGYGVC